MTNLLRLSSYVLSFIIYAQSTAWATGPQTAEDKIAIEKFLKHFHSLSLETRAKEAIKALDARRDGYKICKIFPG